MKYLDNGNIFSYNQNIDYLYKIADLSTIGGRLKYHRTLVGLKQSELSHLSGVSVNAILKIENNKFGYSAQTAQKIALALNLPPESFFDDYLKFTEIDFRKKVKETRVNLDMSQKEFAKALGVTIEVTYTWQNGSKKMSRGSYGKLCGLCIN